MPSALTTLPLAAIALVVIGGPAGVGSSMLYAHLRHSGARPADIVNTRAIVSVAWVAGPPLATFIIGWFGNRAILLAIAAVAVLNMVTTAIMMSHRRRSAAAAAGPATPPPPADDTPSAGSDRADHGRFVLLQATNATGDDDHDPLRHPDPAARSHVGGIALGVAAALEVPALFLIGRSADVLHPGLIATSCLAGIAYYVGLAFVAGPGCCSPCNCSTPGPSPVSPGSASPVPAADPPSGPRPGST